MEFLGIDIGCSSIKYGLVSLEDEIKVRNFDMIAISQAAENDKYAEALSYLLQNTATCPAVGVGFPSVIRENKILRKSVEFNDAWDQVQNILQEKDVPCFAINDADAAGMAEVYRTEAAELRRGVTIMLTLGSGIGSAIFLDGKLIPNTEFGVMEFHGMKAELYAAPSVKIQEALSMPVWAARLQEYLAALEFILPADHLVLGGGISVDFDEFQSMIRTRADLRPAHFRNQAGVIGAAIYAAYQTGYYDPN